MYPNLYYAFKDLLGVEIPVLKIFQTFGFFVAIAFLAGAYVLTRELKRYEKMGLLKGIPEKVITGLPASQGEIIGNAIVGFIIGFKILGIFFQWDTASADLQAYVFSGQGSMVAGILLAVLMGGYKYYYKKKRSLPKPVEQTVLVMPHQRVPDRDLPGDEIDDVAGDEEGADAARAALVEDQRVFRDPLDAADAGTDGDAGIVLLFRGRRMPAGIV